jgi:hypothetical protein
MGVAQPALGTAALGLEVAQPTLGTAAPGLGAATPLGVAMLGLGAVKLSRRVARRSSGRPASSGSSIAPPPSGRLSGSNAQDRRLEQDHRNRRLDSIWIIRFNPVALKGARVIWSVQVLKYL